MRGQKPTLLIAAAVDPSAGAGLLLDLCVARREGLGAAAVVTALTAQSAAGLGALSATPARFLGLQLDALLADLPPFAACKVGVLGSPQAARQMTRFAKAHPAMTLVVDPIWRASRGRGSLMAGDAATYRRALRALLGQADLATPNLIEARWLLDLSARSAAGRDPSELARRLMALGMGAVLIKGGHGTGPRVSDLLLLANGRERVFTHRRLPGAFHGTGCFLSTAIAARLARGEQVERAVAGAIGSLQREMARARPAGRSRVKQLLLA